MAAFRYFSTGVLWTGGITNFNIRVTFVNLDPSNTQQVQVKTKNWNTETIDFNLTLTLDPNSWNGTTSLELSDVYEVRLALEPNIIANVYAYDPLEQASATIKGTRVLFHQLVPIQPRQFELN
ncbi:hypothetical protein NVV31_13265 [Cytobacillus firmus]|uniref:hypothetical protein n=1 Tax=Cytobacillus TaxID=2675230 RepID=UPI001D13D622|nr:MULTISPECIES: hypothetical protein [Cytobacillus]MCC3646840.1 hypothetical protein [Cytobacillus oceanisediminis]MCU1806351.1 hypothetical protein [Cytobacillus firmus]